MKNLNTYLLFVITFLCFNCNNSVLEETQKQSIKSGTIFGIKSDSYITNAYSFNLSNDTMIITRCGNLFWIEAISPRDTVLSIKITECFEAGEMLLNHLTSQHVNGDILQTQGMINVEFDKTLVKDSVIKYTYINKYLDSISIDYSLYDGKYDKDKKCVVWEESTKGITGKAVADAETELLRKFRKNFTFSSFNTGWFNIDSKIVFEDICDYTIAIDGFSGYNFALMLKNYKVIIGGRREGDEIIFENIPENCDAIFVMFQDMSNDMIDFIEVNVRTSKFKNFVKQKSNAVKSDLFCEIINSNWK